MPVSASDLAKLFPLESLRNETRDQLGRDAVVTPYVRHDYVFEAGSVDDDTSICSKASCNANIRMAARSPMWPVHSTVVIR